MEKTDIHCHILPGVDDGAKSEEESLALVRMAAEQGFRKLIATPHGSLQFPNEDPEKLKDLFQKLKEKIRKELPEMELYLGQEIFYTEAVPEKLEKGKLLSLAGSEYVLIEFGPHTSWSEMYRGLRNVRLCGYVPILAHAERYPVLRKQDYIEELLDSDIRVQLNYRSVGGGWTDETARWCKKQLKKGNISFLGTDMHSTAHRPPVTEAAESWMLRHLEEDTIQELLWKNAEEILID